jgi:hypothetical protein
MSVDMNVQLGNTRHFDAGRAGLFQVPASSQEDTRDTRQPKRFPTLLPWVRLRPASLLWSAVVFVAPRRVSGGQTTIALPGNDAP